MRAGAIAALVLAACCAQRTTEPPRPAPRPPAAVATPVPAPESPQPAADAPSIYDLEVRLRDATGRDVGLDVQRGHPTLVAMFYSSCPAACPVLIEEVKRVLAEAHRTDAHVLLVSFDSANDTPERLAELARVRHLDERWTLAAASDFDARAIAAVLGVKYTKLASGAFAHTSVIVGLDTDGHPRARADRAGEHAALVRWLARPPEATSANL